MRTTNSHMKSKKQLEQGIKKHKTAVLLVNTHSRKGGLLFKQAEVLLKQRGFKITHSYAIKDPHFINETIKRALSTKPELLVVGSGDGTISEVVDHLAYCDTVLGFIPLGTTNNFARSLGIPLDIEGAIEVIANGKVADVDLGKVGEDYFANVASIGLTVDVAHSVSSKLKRRIGRLAYALTGLKVLFHHRSFGVTILANDQTYEYRTHQLIIANGRFHGGTLIASDASIDNHSLVIFNLGDVSKLQLLRSLMLFALKKPRTLREENYIITNKATIKTHPPRRLELDGEIKATTPVKVSLAPEALRIMVQKDFTDE